MIFCPSSNGLIEIYFRMTFRNIFRFMKTSLATWVVSPLIIACISPLHAQNAALDKMKWVDLTHPFSSKNTLLAQ